MHSRHVVSGAFLLMAFIGCQDNRTKEAAAQAAGSEVQGLIQKNRVAPAYQAIASAQALASAAAEQSATSITGKVHSVGGELGTWDIVLGECASGESLGF